MAGDRGWIERRLGKEAFERLASGLALSDLGSVWMSIAERRARGRTHAELMRQWREDRFVAPSVVDPRAQRRVELALFEAAEGFEPIELSPLAPLGVCSRVAPASQHKIVATSRAAEVASDPTNLLALLCAERLRARPGVPVRLASAQRVVRGQPAPKGPGFAQHFALFALASGAREAADHAVLEAETVAHVEAQLRGLERLRAEGHPLPPSRLSILATEARAHVADRIAARFAAPERGLLTHAYYDGGLRFQITLGDDGGPIPIIDGGAFSWLGTWLGDRRHVFVASGCGSQLVAVKYPSVRSSRRGDHHEGSSPSTHRSA